MEPVQPVFTNEVIDNECVSSSGALAHCSRINSTFLSHILPKSKAAFISLLTQTLMH